MLLWVMLVDRDKWSKLEVLLVLFSCFCLFVVILCIFVVDLCVIVVTSYWNQFVFCISIDIVCLYSCFFVFLRLV